LDNKVSANTDSPFLYLYIYIYIYKSVVQEPNLA